MNKVVFQASQVEISNVQSNDIYMSVLMRMFSTRPNRNGYAVSEAFMDNIVANAGKYACLPQCADAGKLRRGDTMGLTHMLDMGSGEFESEQIGSFFSFAKATDEFGVSLIGEARIPKRNPRLCETLLAMYNAGTLSFSFEIMVSEMNERDGMLMIDAAEGNELIGMAVVSTPAYPEATALKLVAENKHEEEPETMDENLKRIAELEAKLKLAEEQAKDKDKEDELKKKDEELEEVAAKKKECEAELASVKAQLSEKEARVTELEAQVGELMPFKAEAEALKSEKAAAELAAKQQELAAFAEAQGLDVAAETVAAAIKGVDYAALIAEVTKQNKKNETKPVVASYAMTNGLPAKGEYGDLLDKA